MLLSFDPHKSDVPAVENLLLTITFSNSTDAGSSIVNQLLPTLTVCAFTKLKVVVVAPSNNKLTSSPACISKSDVISAIVVASVTLKKQFGLSPHI